MKREVIKINKSGKLDFAVTFDQVGQEREWVGVVDARNPGEYELQVIADHKVEGTRGRITVRAVVGAGARVALRGMIKIRKEAQKTDDFLELRVLMIDETARAIAEPELEIEANNVKASHAASVGQIDQEQLLYLTSRGLTREMAQEQIVNGWLGV